MKSLSVCGRAKEAQLDRAPARKKMQQQIRLASSDKIASQTPGLRRSQREHYRSWLPTTTISSLAIQACCSRLVSHLDSTSTTFATSCSSTWSIWHLGRMKRKRSLLKRSSSPSLMPHLKTWRHLRRLGRRTTRAFGATSMICPTLKSPNHSSPHACGLAMLQTLPRG